MRSALVGSTGFVGGNLLRQAPFDECFHSTDIETIQGRAYDLLVCAGAPAEKWKANRDPEKDRANLERLMHCLAGVRAGHVVLISTVDVYGSPIDVDEDSPIDTSIATAYGRHRFELEQFVRGRFETTCIRLPGLFGRGLKKNIVYDLLHGNLLDAICPDSAFQFYGLDTLWRDISRARTLGLRLVNFAVEPVTVRDVASEAFGIAFENPSATTPVRYDMHSRHAEAMGGAGVYLQNRAQVLSAIRAFVEASRQDQA